jgi:hypothetical protein
MRATQQIAAQMAQSFVQTNGSDDDLRLFASLGQKEVLELANKNIQGLWVICDEFTSLCNQREHSRK